MRGGLLKNGLQLGIDSALCPVLEPQLAETEHDLEVILVASHQAPAAAWQHLTWPPACCLQKRPLLLLHHARQQANLCVAISLCVFTAHSVLLSTRLRSVEHLALTSGRCFDPDDSAPRTCNTTFLLLDGRSQGGSPKDIRQLCRDREVHADR